MKKCNVIAVSPSIKIDVIDRKTNVGHCLMSDGEYKWTYDLIYYVEKYDMELPDEFIKHVLKKIKK